MPISGVPFDVHIDAFSHTWTSLARSLHNSIIRVNSLELFTKAAAHPILLLHSRSDTVAPYDGVLQMKQKHHKVQLVIMDGEGHNNFLNSPESTWERIREFEPTFRSPNRVNSQN